MLRETALPRWGRRWFVCAAAVATVHAALAAADDDVLAARRARIAQMTLAEKDQLLRQSEQFARLSPQRRDELRELQRRIDADPDARQLQRVMHRYHEWLMNEVSPSERARLLKMAPDERIESIKRLRAFDLRRERVQLSPEEIAAATRWMDEETAATLNDEQRQRLAGLPPDLRSEMLLFVWLQRRQRSGRGMEWEPSPDDAAGIRAALDARRSALVERLPRDRRRWLVARWLGQVVDQRMEHISDEALHRFLVEEMSEEWRSRLLSLPPDEMQRQLRIAFLARKAAEQGLAQRWRGPRPGEPRRDGRGDSRRGSAGGPDRPRDRRP